MIHEMKKNPVQHPQRIQRIPPNHLYAVQDSVIFGSLFILRLMLFISIWEFVHRKAL